MNSLTAYTNADLHNSSGYRHFLMQLEESLKLLQPLPALLVSEYADGHRVLSVETANEPGEYKVSKAMFQKEPQDVFVAEPWVRQLTLMWASRCGKTTIIENRMGYKIVRQGGNILIILPSDKKAKRWSKVNLKPFIRDNYDVRERMLDQSSRSEENEILLKQYRGGLLVIGGANVPGSLSSWSMEEVYFDEIDEYGPSAEKEGDPIELGKQRAENFLSKRFIFASTPTIKGVSRIEEQWLESDQRLYFVPCPHCGHKQILIFSPRSMFAHLTTGYLKYLHKGFEVTYVAYECASCKKDIPHRYKAQMIRTGEWRKMKPHVTEHAGFQISRLYSPWVSWKETVANFLRTEKRPERYMVFINKALGELWVDNISHEFSEDLFLARREPYEKIPLGVVVLTIGVDIQDDRLEAFVWGWGLNEESWFIEHGVIAGSPEDALTWKMLDLFIIKDRKYENGFPARFGEIGGILAVAVDTGDHTKAVNAYIAKRKRNRFIAIKGNNRPQKDFVVYSRSKKQRNPLVLVDTHQGKKIIYHRLAIERQKDVQQKPLPTPHYMHFNMRCEMEFFEQLMSERLVIKKIGGYPRQVWSLPSGKRNEVLDGTDYALAALHVISPGGSKNVEGFLQRLSEMLSMRTQQWELAHPDEKAGGIAAEGKPGETGSGQPVEPKPDALLQQSKIKVVRNIKIDLQ